MKTFVIATVSGLLFGAGLALSGMTNPDKVLNFLDVSGRWDPSLALVMGGALLVTLPAFMLLQRRRGLKPEHGPIDRRLLLGSALFGIGWGTAGYCPGPALANLAQPSTEILLFVLAMIGGSQLARVLLPTR